MMNHLLHAKRVARNKYIHLFVAMAKLEKFIVDDLDVVPVFDRFEPPECY